MAKSVLIVDDHPLFRQALVIAAGSVFSGAKILEAGSLEEAVSVVQSNKDLDIILLDLKIPGASGYSGVALIHSEAPNVPILVISGSDAQRAASDAKRFGAIGFIGKDNDLGTIETAIKQAVEGGQLDSDDFIPKNKEVDEMAQKVASLTPMQLRVLIGVLNGRLNKQIAYDLGISEATVKAHLTAIFKKLDVGNRTQAALAAQALGIGMEN